MPVLALLLSLAVSLAPSFDKELDAALERFHAALAGSDRNERGAALEALVTLGNPDAGVDLLAELALSARERDEQARRLERARFALERRQIVLEMLEQLAQRDDDLDERLRAEREAIDDLKRSVKSLERRVTLLENWRTELLAATGGLLGSAKAAKRKKIEADLWQDVQEHPEADVRVAAAITLGELGGPGTPARLARLSADGARSIGKLRKSLADEMSEVRKLEKRLQAESDQSGGRTSRAGAQQYDRIRGPARALQSQIADQERVSEELARAAGRCLAREQDAELDQSMKAILKLLRKQKDLARLNLVLVLESCDSDAARSSLRALLEVEQDPALRAELIDSVASQGDAEAIGWLLEQGLMNPNWRVSSRAAAALARLRARAAVPLLIERLDVVEGRLRSDYGAALASLTGEDFHGNVSLWRRWWADHEQTFEVPAKAPARTALEAVRASAGMTFFGVESESQSVLLVLDLSGSMNFSMTPKRNPDDSSGRPPDMPGEGEISRLAAARQALVKALGGLRDGARFNLVTYATDVWSWSNDPVEMEPEARAELVAYVDSLKAEGGTNIYGALAHAFDLAGAEGGGSWNEPVFDTMYLLTDGKASVGVSTEADQILALVQDRNRGPGIVIHTIGLSAAHDADLLSKLAQATGGTYVAR